MSCCIYFFQISSSWFRLSSVRLFTFVFEPSFLFFFPFTFAKCSVFCAFFYCFSAIRNILHLLMQFTLYMKHTGSAAALRQNRTRRLARWCAPVEKHITAWPQYRFQCGPLFPWTMTHHRASHCVKHIGSAAALRQSRTRRLARCGGPAVRRITAWPQYRFQYGALFPWAMTHHRASRCVRLRLSTTADPVSSLTSIGAERSLSTLLRCFFVRFVNSTIHSLHFSFLISNSELTMLSSSALPPSAGFPPGHFRSCRTPGYSRVGSFPRWWRWVSFRAYLRRLHNTMLSSVYCGKLPVLWSAECDGENRPHCYQKKIERKIFLQKQVIFRSCRCIACRLLYRCSWSI